MTQAPKAAPSLERSAWRAAAAEYAGLFLFLSLLVAVFGLTTQNFLTRSSLVTIVNQIPAAILLATAMTYVLALGEIDLSVGSVLGLCGALFGVAVVRWGLPPAVATVLAMLMGLTCGAFNGWVTLHWRLPSFIVTLGMLEIARGGAHALTQSSTQYVGGSIEWIASTQVLGVSLASLLALVVVVVAQLVLSRTVFGRYMIAIGTNAGAVRLSGINPHPVRLVVFMLAGLLVALAAVIETSRIGSANPNAGSGFELQAIAAAVIGGTSLMGGRASVISSFLGVLIMAVLEAGLSALGARDETKRILTGAVIVVAVIVDYYRMRLFRGRLS